MQTGRAYAGSNTPELQSIQIDHTGMGEAAERNRGFRKEKLHRRFRKINPEKLMAYVAKYPNAYQSEIAKAFGCSESGICDALRWYYYWGN